MKQGAATAGLSLFDDKDRPPPPTRAMLGLLGERPLPVRRRVRVYSVPYNAISKTLNLPRSPVGQYTAS